MNFHHITKTIVFCVFYDISSKEFRKIHKNTSETFLLYALQTHNGGHNILRLNDVLINSCFTTSETRHALLVIKTVYTSCIKSCQKTYDLRMINMFLKCLKISKIPEIVTNLPTRTKTFSILVKN